ncbi:aldehyde dehydrogenase family protein [Microbacterium sp. H1-D42]|uniref:aldehyde dehydrogenase family protein n=1 Tax=Microbacterium sp. H1-D42 TaxID=2925844 RepID=UPI001F534F28|nr:aldehyde dehydrogenase family protein [Microbacterium sp. H1-D42]UNK72072.1 aldehyde dehydrogenase family protein [Microbacterium sp. H1-D42]
MSAAAWPARAERWMPETSAFIDGAFTAIAGATAFETISPRDGAVIARLEDGGAPAADAAVAAARKAFDDGRWRRLEPRARAEIMRRFAALVLQSRDELALAESLDVGKPITQMLTAEVDETAEAIRWYADAIDKVHDEVLPSPEHALLTVTREPMGVIAAIVPWNFSIIIAAWKFAPALATGNSVVLKPSELSTLPALILARLAAEAGIPDGVFNVVPGRGATVGAALAQHPDVDKVTFTGSTAVGRRVAVNAASSNGKAVAIEAGGKSPQVVFEDVEDLDRLAETVAASILYNAGQACTAGSRLLVQEGVHDQVVEKVLAAAAAWVPADPLSEATKMGAIASRAQLDGILATLTANRSGDLLTGGEPVEPVRGGFYLPPTIVDHVDNASPIAQQEVFGPVLTISTFRDEAEALHLANDTVYGLAASVWTGSLGRAHRMTREMHAGIVWANDFNALGIDRPFGGVKGTGSGRDKGVQALTQYTTTKTSWIDFRGAGG